MISSSEHFFFFSFFSQKVFKRQRNQLDLGVGERKEELVNAKVKMMTSAST